VKITKTISFFILSFIVTFFVIESLSGYLLNWIKRNDQIVSNPRNNNQIDLYEGYSWKDEYFESLEVNKPPGNSYFPYVMWTTRNRNGLVSQDENGVRASYIPKKTGKEIYRIYTFGASTMENIEVPSEYTIASNLVKLLSSSSLNNEYDFEIFNFGSGAYNNTQEMIRLIYEYQRGFKDYGKPNLVVFFDGANDIFSGVYLERPGIHDAYDRIRLRYDDINDFYLLKIKELLRNKLKTIQLFDYLRGKKVQEDFRYIENKDMDYSNYAKKSVAIYKKNMEIVKALGSESGFDSLFFLQPSVFTLKNGTKYDQDVFELWERKGGGMYEAFVHGYSQFIMLSHTNEDLVNLSGVFNNINKPIYKDYVHFGPFGSEKIAESMFPYVKKIIKMNSHD
jgi:hypothetical protein